MNIVKYTPTETMIALRKCNNVELCLNSDTPALSELRKDNGEDKVLTMLEMWILDINEFFNVQRKMKPNQIKETALMILEDFYYLRVADLNYVFSNAKKGRYGELYGTLDGSKVYAWFVEHDNERASMAYKERLREHDNLKAQELGR